MPSLTTFADFVIATDQKVITPTDDILNEAVKNTYILKSAQRGRGDDELMQGGSSLVDMIQLSDNGSFQFYEPYQELNPTAVDTLTKVSINWRFAEAHYVWSEEEIQLNEGDQEATYKKLLKSKKQACHTSMFNGMEDACWAFPSATSMEAASGKVAYSIPAFIDEIGTDYHWPGFTTIMGVDPELEDRWRNQISRYNSADPFDAENGIIPAFDDQWLKVKFESPEQASDYFANDTLNKMKIVSNRDGVKKYKQALRMLNDRTVSAQDPAYNSPVYSGVPVQYVSTLDTALLDQEAASTTPAAWAAGAPRYMFLNFSFMYPIYHTNRYMVSTDPMNDVKQPWSYVVYKNTYYNWFCRSRQRQGIVTPVGFGG